MTKNSVENEMTETALAGETVTEPTPTENETSVVEEAEEKSDRGNREAAKYRRQLRDTETERDSLRTALTSARTEILRAAVTGYKIDGNTFNADALDDAGIDVEEVFGDDGRLDQDNLDAAMAAIADDKPYMFAPPQRMIIPSEGRAPATSDPNNWTDAFAPKQ